MSLSSGVWGKQVSCRHFFQYASFIASGPEAPGGGVTLDEAYMSFFCLVGATYFRVHASESSLQDLLPYSIFVSASGNGNCYTINQDIPRGI